MHTCTANLIVGAVTIFDIRPRSVAQLLKLLDLMSPHFQTARSGYFKSFELANHYSITGKVEAHQFIITQLNSCPKEVQPRRKFSYHEYNLLFHTKYIVSIHHQYTSN